MLVSAFIASDGPVRPVLQDAAGNRFSDATLRAFLTESVREMFARHPETRASANYGRRAIPAATLATTDEVPVADIHLNALASLVCWRAFSTDAKDEVNRAQAGMHREAYEAFFRGED